MLHTFFTWSRLSACMACIFISTCDLYIRLIYFHVLFYMSYLFSHVIVYDFFLSDIRFYTIHLLSRLSFPARFILHVRFSHNSLVIFQTTFFSHAIFTRTVYHWFFFFINVSSFPPVIHIFSHIIFTQNKFYTIRLFSHVHFSCDSFIFT